MPLIETRGTASSRAFGQFARPADAINYIEDLFSTYLYTGNGSTQTITNGIDLSTKGGLLWIKGRSANSSHWLVDTARGNTKGLYTDGTVGEQTSTGGSDVSGFSSSGFSLGTNQQALVNTNGGTFASWTFRKQAKFFDIVTYTGNGSSSRLVNHSLGSAPGLVIIKALNTTSNWPVMFAPTAPANAYGFSGALASGGLNSTGEGYSLGSVTGVSTSTQFRVGGAYWGGFSETNDTGVSYIAYLFANNAGGFGPSGTENGITCGTYVGNGSTTGPVINLGYEPQWILIKNRETGTTDNWVIVDTMRGLSVNGAAQRLYPNASGAESSTNPYINVSATGFQPVVTNSQVNASGSNYMYMAIRRGPMRTPTSGTSVFAPVAYTGTASTATITTGIVTDAALFAQRPSPHHTRDGSRLTGIGYLSTSTTDEERNGVTDGMWQANPWDVMNGVNVANTLYGNSNYINWSFRRAPGFFDVVAYTGTGVSGRTVSHNLGVVPELIIIKRRDATNFWHVWSANVTAPETNWWHNYQLLNTTQAAASWTTGLTSAPTASALTVGDGSNINASAATYIAYLFASCPGVSKVGGYIGTGTTQQINCGFTGGARFVMIKRADSTSDWYVWDTARGIVAGNDPFLLLNSTSPEVTNTDLIDPLSTGFEISSAFSTNGGNYIFLAIA